MWQFPLNTIAPCSWTPEESQVECCEHQDNANIHCQPFPESVSEEHNIYSDDDGCHRHHVEHDSYLSAHFSSLRSQHPYGPAGGALGRFPQKHGSLVSWRASVTSRSRNHARPMA